MSPVQNKLVETVIILACFLEVSVSNVGWDIVSHETFIASLCQMLHLSIYHFQLIIHVEFGSSLLELGQIIWRPDGGF